VTEGGLAVGFEEDRDYFGPLERALLDRLILTPPELPRIMDLAASRYVTLRFLLQTPDLAFVSVWNPSFLTLLVESIPEHAERLVDDVRRGTLNPPRPLPVDMHRALAARLRPRPRRAAALARLLAAPGSLPEVWPGLTTISCWASAAAAHFVPRLCQHFPGVEIQPKGLLAVEGVASIPVSGQAGAALAVTSHFLEFVPVDDPGERPLLADELELGQEYTVVLSTGGGLYRYALGDGVRVVGYLHATPLVEFLGRAGPISDVCGEKLHEQRVRAVLADAAGALRLSPEFALLAPEWGPPAHYALFVECSGLSPGGLQALLARVEAGLAESHPYSYCRRLGQLGPLRGYCLPRGAARAYLERCVALGQRAGDVKPAALHREPGWAAWFRGAWEVGEGSPIPPGLVPPTSGHRPP
jgi:hypothetical protein